VAELPNPRYDKLEFRDGILNYPGTADIVDRQCLSEHVDFAVHPEVDCTPAVLIENVIDLSKRLGGFVSQPFHPSFQSRRLAVSVRALFTRYDLSQLRECLDAPFGVFDEFVERHGRLSRTELWILPPARRRRNSLWR
jgi:hypothetical protein